MKDANGATLENGYYVSYVRERLGRKGRGIARILYTYKADGIVDMVALGASELNERNTRVEVERRAGDVVLVDSGKLADRWASSSLSREIPVTFDYEGNIVATAIKLESRIKLVEWAVNEKLEVRLSGNHIPVGNQTRVGYFWHYDSNQI